MREEKPMSALAIGETARVGKIGGDSAMCKRLRDLGLIEGTATQCVLNSIGSAMSAYTIRGAVIAIRKEDAVKVSVYTS